MTRGPGAVAIESERAIAEAQGRLVIAKRFPKRIGLGLGRHHGRVQRPGLAKRDCRFLAGLGVEGQHPAG